MAAVVLLAVAACGAPPPGAILDVRPVMGGQPAPGNTPGGSPEGQPGAGQPRAGLDPTVLPRVQRAANTLLTMSGEVAFYETDGSSTQYGSGAFWFHTNPFQARVDIQDTNRSFASGASMVYDGTNVTIKARSYIPITLTRSETDGLVTSLHGWTLSQTDIFSMVHVLLAPGARIQQIGMVPIEDQPRLMLQVRSPASASGVDHELIGIDTRFWLPTYREMYQGNLLVQKGVGRNLVVNQSIDPSKFSL